MNTLFNLCHFISSKDKSPLGLQLYNLHKWNDFPKKIFKNLFVLLYRGLLGGQTLVDFGTTSKPQTIFTPKLIYQGKFYQREFNEIFSGHLENDRCR